MTKTRNIFNVGVDEVEDEAYLSVVEFDWLVYFTYAEQFEYEGVAVFQNSDGLWHWDISHRKCYEPESKPTRITPRKFADLPLEVRQEMFNIYQRETNHE